MRGQPILPLLSLRAKRGNLATGTELYAVTGMIRLNTLRNDTQPSYPKRYARAAQSWNISARSLAEKSADIRLKAFHIT